MPPAHPHFDLTFFDPLHLQGRERAEGQTSPGTHDLKCSGGGCGAYRPGSEAWSKRDVRQSHNKQVSGLVFGTSSSISDYLSYLSRSLSPARVPLSYFIYGSASPSASPRSQVPVPAENNPYPTIFSSSSTHDIQEEAQTLDFPNYNCHQTTLCSYSSLSVVSPSIKCPWRHEFFRCSTTLAHPRSRRPRNGSRGCRSKGYSILQTSAHLLLERRSRKVEEAGEFT